MEKLSSRRLIAIAVVAVIGAAAWKWLQVPSLSVLREWATQTGPWFPILFWLLYVLITQFPIPRTVMTLSSGVLFGSFWGVAISITAATAAAVVSLVVVRGLLRDWIAPRLTHPSVELVNQRLEERGLLAVASLRMIAIVPFSIMNYAAALTRVKIVPFAVATFVGSLPTTAAVVLFGDTLTGEANVVVIALMIVLSVLGLAGLLVDAFLPTPQRVESQGESVDNYTQKA